MLRGRRPPSGSASEGSSERSVPGRAGAFKCPTWHPWMPHAEASARQRFQPSFLVALLSDGTIGEDWPLDKEGSFSRVMHAYFCSLRAGTNRSAQEPCSRTLINVLQCSMPSNTPRNGILWRESHGQSEMGQRDDCMRSTSESAATWQVLPVKGSWMQ